MAAPPPDGTSEEVPAGQGGGTAGFPGAPDLAPGPNMARGEGLGMAPTGPNAAPSPAPGEGAPRGPMLVPPAFACSLGTRADHPPGEGAASTAPPLGGVSPPSAAVEAGDPALDTRRIVPPSDGPPCSPRGLGILPDRPPGEAAAPPASPLGGASVHGTAADDPARDSSSSLPPTDRRSPGPAGAVLSPLLEDGLGTLADRVPGEGAAAAAPPPGRSCSSFGGGGRSGSSLPPPSPH